MLRIFLLTVFGAFAEQDCRANTRLGHEGEFPLVMLTSIQGSGNTWTRQLLESATGIYTGSIYNETRIFTENGFKGEIEPMLSGKTIGNKNHGLRHLAEAGAIILVIRNPYNTLKAEFNRKHTIPEETGGKGLGHVGHADPAAFNTTDWDDFVVKMSGRWVRHYHRYISESASKNIPLKIVYYENLQADSVREIKQVLEFLEEAIGFKADKKKQRLSCISNAQMNAFKRVKKPLGWEVYTPEMTKNINKVIASLRDTIDEFNYQPMPEYTKILPSLIEPSSEK